MKIHGTAFKTYGITSKSRKNFGNISVGESEVKMKANTSKAKFSIFFLCEKYQMATPKIAIT
ncbi:hypothetical protein JGI2_00380 [Candidatus Kryptobacter tengchongensis]|nr:hypothetical protein JGI2_00380 [Candidatus Kryptobacter tengchongensis]